MNEARANRILAALKEQGVDQMLITDPMSICYLTGISMAPIERFYALLLKADGHHYYFLNHLFNVPGDVGVEKVWYSDTDPVPEIVAARLDKNAVLGVDKDLKARFLLPLMEMKAAAGFVNGSLAVDITRGVKDTEEQKKMRISSAINDKAMAKFKGLIHEGVSEKEVADQMLQIYLDLGADGYSFEPLVAFGANAADPHHSPDDTVVKPGDCVLFDVGCIKDGYCSDMTRTFYFKTVSDAHREVYETTKASNETAISKIRPGVPLYQLDAAARDLISAKGWGPNPGMIFSIEPGIYLTGDTGVRVEDLVLVTEDGVEVLNHYPKELQIIE